MPIRDYLYRIHGDCIRAGYAYPLLAAIKLNDPELAADQRAFFGPLEGVGTIGRGYLTIRERTCWRVRAPSELTDRLRKLCGRKLLIGDHVIQLGELHTEAIRPASQLYAEFIAIKSMHFQKGDRHPTHREFLGWVTDKLKRKYKLDHGKVEVGRRRRLHIGQYPATTGYALGVYGIDPKTSQEIQRSGLGGRRHMGGALFLPGMLPRWCQDERRCFDIVYVPEPKKYSRYAPPDKRTAI
jgi:CRISPR-associated protein Cas6